MKSITESQFQVEQNIASLFSHRRSKQYSVVNDFLEIQEQSRLLQSIRDQIMKKKLGLDLCGISQMHQSQSTCHSFLSTQLLSDDNNSVTKNKFMEEMEESMLECALREVRQCCSLDTYETIKKACQNSKGIQFYNLQKYFEKSKKQIEELNNSNISLQKQKSNILWELNLLKPKITNIEEQKNKIKKQIDQLNKKQALVSRIQTSFLLKQKMCNQGKKRYQRQQQSVQLLQHKLNQSYNQFWQLWQKINNKCQQIKCSENCWKKDVIKKCKNKLLEFREVLKLQENQIDKESEIMFTLSQQFKNLALNCQILKK